MITRRTIILFCLAFIVIPASAQYVMRPGYLVLAQGDTLHGEVANEMDAAIMRGVQFKSRGGKLERYAPDAIRTFFYEKDNLFESINPAGELVLLRCLVKGHYSLYVVPGKDGGTYYLKKNDGSFDVLKNTISETIVNGHTYKKKGYEYIATLKLSTLDKPSLIPMIDKASFERDDLAAVVKAYNDAQPGATPSAQYSKKGKMIVRAGVMAGYSFYLGESGAVRGGVLTTFRSGKDKAQFGVNLGVLYNEADYPGEKGRTIDIPLYLSYDLTTNKKLTPYVYAGLMLQHSKGTVEAGSYRFDYSDLVGPNLLIGAGADYNKHFKADIFYSAELVGISVGYMF